MRAYHRRTVGTVRRCHHRWPGCHMAVSGSHSGAVAVLVSGSVWFGVVLGTLLVNPRTAGVRTVVVSGAYSFRPVIIVIRPVARIQSIISVSGTVLVIYTGSIVAIAIVRTVIIAVVSVVGAIRIVIYTGTSSGVMSRTGV